jgi:protein-S-isoprenylcysteine O-methyltransferase Ste14
VGGERGTRREKSQPEWIIFVKALAAALVTAIVFHVVFSLLDFPDTPGWIFDVLLAVCLAGGVVYGRRITTRATVNAPIASCSTC